MMKKYIGVVLSVCLLMSMMMIPSMADVPVSYTYTELEDGSIELTGREGATTSYMERWVTPTYVDGKLVTVIGDIEIAARTMVFSEGVTTIKDDAFYWYSMDLEDVIFPSTLEYIGDRALLGPNTGLDSKTKPLKLAVIPPSVTYMGEKCVGYLNVEELGMTEFGVWPIEDFTIYGTAGTVAEQYAIDNGFGFVDMATFVPCGDVTLDDEVDMEDAFAMYKVASGETFETSAVLLEGDLDGNQEINMSDAYAVYATASGE